MLPGLAAGAGLVLLSTIKELPATLLLRPTGIDTLALEVWRARETANWPRPAWPAWCWCAVGAS